MKPELIIGGVSYPWTFANWTWRTLAGFIVDNVTGDTTGEMHCVGGAVIRFTVRKIGIETFQVSFGIPQTQVNRFIITKRGVIESQ